MIPTILFKTKRVALWLWLGAAICIASSALANHMGWGTVANILSGGIWLFALSFGACVVLTIVVICMLLFRFLIGRRRNV